MREDFSSAVTALWLKLGLGVPRIITPGRLRLRIERFGVDLADSGTGLLVAEGIAGRFSKDPQASARQARRVLESNLGLILANRATVHIRAMQKGDKALAVRATYRIGTLDLDRLTGTIEDVVETMEFYAPEFQTSDKPASRPAPSPANPETAMIFRP